MGIVSRLFESINGIYWFPLIALAIFIVFFALVTIHTMRMKKSKEQECSAIPFENDERYESHEV